MRHVHLVALNQHRLPRKYRNHPLIQGKVYYTLPRPLLWAIEREFDRRPFGQEQHEMEEDLAESLDDNQFEGGYANGVPIVYDWLSPETPPLPRPDEGLLEKSGRKVNLAEYDLAMEIARKRMDSLRLPLRGYLGWLMTHRPFLSERDALFTTWAAETARHGIPQTGATIRPVPSGTGLAKKVTGQRMQRFLKEFTDSYTKWRLQHLVTKELPVPLAPQSPVLSPQAFLEQLRSRAVSYTQPDTMPIPPRDSLRDMLDDQYGGEEKDHLKRWLRVIRRGRSNNESIIAFGQIFTVQHYWRVIEKRYPNVVKSNVGRLEKAFARFMKRSPEAIAKYRRRIRRRLASG